MPLPHVRFTVRRLMVAAATGAIAVKADWLRCRRADPGITTRWPAWAAATCLLVGAVVPFAVLPEVLKLELVLDGHISPTVYVMSWLLLSVVPTYAAGGFIVVFSGRNRKSITAAGISPLLILLCYVPIIAGFIGYKRHAGMSSVSYKSDIPIGCGGG